MPLRGLFLCPPDFASFANSLLCKELACSAETKEEVRAIFDVALAEKDPEFLLSVIGDIARSKGMVQLARELNLDRKGLYKAFSSGGNP
ncbi:MAG: putative addiction module antidote protein, partial [Treponema sp.]|nr:putative addiction module antidote protein [Treponema sp.]